MTVRRRRAATSLPASYWRGGACLPKCWQPCEGSTGLGGNDQLVCPLFWVPLGQPCVVFRAPGSSNYLVPPVIFRMHPISNSFDLNIRPLVLPVPAFGTVLPMNLMEAPVLGPGFSVDRDTVPLPRSCACFLGASTTPSPPPEQGGSISHLPTQDTSTGSPTQGSSSCPQDQCQSSPPPMGAASAARASARRP